MNITPVFIRCKHPTIEYGRYTLENHPINISLIARLKKTKEAYYPDNIGIPALDFDPIEKTEKQFRWCYNNLKDRDEDYERILNLFASGGSTGE